ncbi:unnamed protein product [Vitrella brassicaformis CCMP3155]|uniref:EF-hand domain-containing protein n=2 Tax=Vitrella brassicaformis TaxID=1169539 RepID=A0A0G4FA63_VITBC|nr:unnamed protein product [Vitrella brassicaformis CCMP3155]|eukprot:CEM09186.1 unnamed protein product [Vitrella brassicaformis CCMP3155]
MSPKTESMKGGEWLAHLTPQTKALFLPRKVQKFKELRLHFDEDHLSVEVDTVFRDTYDLFVNYLAKADIDTFTSPRWRMVAQYLLSLQHLAATLNIQLSDRRYREYYNIGHLDAFAWLTLRHACKIVLLRHSLGDRVTQTARLMTLQHRLLTKALQLYYERHDLKTAHQLLAALKYFDDAYSTFESAILDATDKMCQGMSHRLIELIDAARAIEEAAKCPTGDTFIALHEARYLAALSQVASLTTLYLVDEWGTDDGVVRPSNPPSTEFSQRDLMLFRKNLTHPLPGIRYLMKKALRYYDGLRRLLLKLMEPHEKDQSHLLYLQISRNGLLVATISKLSWAWFHARNWLQSDRMEDIAKLQELVAYDTAALRTTIKEEGERAAQIYLARLVVFDELMSHDSSRDNEGGTTALPQLCGPALSSKEDGDMPSFRITWSQTSDCLRWMSRIPDLLRSCAGRLHCPHWGQRFCLMTRLRSQLRERYGHHIRRAFARIDINRDRDLTEEEIRDAFSLWNLSFDRREIHIIFEIIDVDKSGTINPDELLEMFLNDEEMTSRINRMCESCLNLDLGPPRHPEESFLLSCRRALHLADAKMPSLVSSTSFGFDESTDAIGDVAPTQDNEDEASPTHERWSKQARWRMRKQALKGQTVLESTAMVNENQTYPLVADFIPFNICAFANHLLLSLDYWWGLSRIALSALVEEVERSSRNTSQQTAFKDIDSDTHLLEPPNIQQLTKTKSQKSLHSPPPSPQGKHLLPDHSPGSLKRGATKGLLVRQGTRTIKKGGMKKGLAAGAATKSSRGSERERDGGEEGLASERTVGSDEMDGMVGLEVSRTEQRMFEGGGWQKGDRNMLSLLDVLFPADIPCSSSHSSFEPTDPLLYDPKSRCHLRTQLTCQSTAKSPQAAALGAADLTLQSPSRFLSRRSSLARSSGRHSRATSISIADEASREQLPSIGLGSRRSSAPISLTPSSFLRRRLSTPQHDALRPATSPARRILRADNVSMFVKVVWSRQS